MKLIALTSLVSALVLASVLLPRLVGDRASAAPVGAARYIVYRDPATGRTDLPVPKDALLRLPDELRASLSTSAVGLTEVPSPVPGGGVVLHLQGRFRNAVVASPDGPEGTATRCISGTDPATAADGRSDGRKEQ